jgi:membrane-anchored protein YejM (alkaline phosphatase superfamily)
VNVVFIVVDSLRYDVLQGRFGDASTPFFRRLASETTSFRRAYATECWTLPAHVSMFTGLLPSEHQAHFQSMGYHLPNATVAERFEAAGYHTELVTRNSIFDGTLTGVTRGFQRNTLLLSERGGRGIGAMFLALSKPRFRRQIRASGFFSQLQRENREFAMTFARAILPADRRVLSYALDQMAALRRTGTRYFLFLNLYDVHAPYSPSLESIFRPPWPPSGWPDRLVGPVVLARIGSHAYLRDGFRLWRLSRQLLSSRYVRAVELMDSKLEAFYQDARSAGLLDDTLLVITSDHGEAFGDHDLYLHDASVYDTHLHVPLFVRLPGSRASVVDDVVSMRDVAGLLQIALRGRRTEDTIMDPDYRAAHPVALAEHFFYPHARGAASRYRQNLRAAIAGDCKIIIRREGTFRYRLVSDPAEESPERGSANSFAADCRAMGVPGHIAADMLNRLSAWEDAARN